MTISLVLRFHAMPVLFHQPHAMPVGGILGLLAACRGDAEFSAWHGVRCRSNQLSCRHGSCHAEMKCHAGMVLAMLK